MRMSQYPKCCGGVILSAFPNLDAWYYGYSRLPKPSIVEGQLKKKLNTARFEDNRCFAMAVFSVSENAPYVKKLLIKYGFKAFDEEVNPRNNHRLIHYKCDLKKITKPL